MRARAYSTQRPISRTRSPSTTHSSSPTRLEICRARSWTELMARPQSDRIVIRQGQQIDRTLPDFSELDHLMS